LALKNRRRTWTNPVPDTSGTPEMTSTEFFKLLMKFFKAIAGDFLSEEVTTLGAQISSAKLWP
jgi:hypothetical protein